MKWTSKLKFLARDLIYPGVDLYTRHRAALACFWKKGPRDVLDAGSGNGYLSWLAYKSGANVTALNFEPNQVSKAREYFLGHRGLDPARISFEQCNLYDLPAEKRTFDEIMCYEVLEHIKRDAEVLAQFYRVLRPGGVLHLCCPNSEHPWNVAEELDLEERGGHVRPGYTEQDFRGLLEQIGFDVERVVGFGSGLATAVEAVFRTIRNHLGDFWAIPLLPIASVILKIDRFDPPVPFSIYVKGVKRAV